MHSVLISLASNYRQEEHLRQAREALVQILSSACYTKEIWTEPVGKSSAEGVLYLNQLVQACCELDSDELNQRLKDIEKALGRTDSLRLQGLVPIDLDLLQHDEIRFHERDWQRSYVRDLLVMLDESEPKYQKP